MRGERRRQRDSLIERLALASLAAPALLLVLITMLAPVAWLFALSFIGDDGGLSLTHYRRLLEQPSYARTFVTTFNVSLLTRDPAGYRSYFPKLKVVGPPPPVRAP